MGHDPAAGVKGIAAIDRSPGATPVAWHRPQRFGAMVLTGDARAATLWRVPAVAGAARPPGSIAPARPNDKFGRRRHSDHPLVPEWWVMRPLVWSGAVAVGLVVLYQLPAQPGGAPGARNPADEPVGAPESLKATFAGLEPGKATRAQVFAALGPPDKVVCPDQFGSPNVEDLTWNRVTAVQVEFKDGKVDRWTAAFSPLLPSATVTPENADKLAPGLSEKEVAAVLGEKYARVAGQDDPDGTFVGVWGQTVRMTVSVIREDNGKGRYKKGTVGGGKSLGYQSPPFGKIW